MKRLLAIPVLLVALLAVAAVGAGQGNARPAAKLPKGFFGIGPQTVLTGEDAEYMGAGGVESIRLPISWPNVQRTAQGGYDWHEVDLSVAAASRQGIQVLPFIWGTPSWLAGKSTTMPLNNRRQRVAWSALLRAAVERYGPGGQFWTEHATEGEDGEPAIRPARPIRTWQIWNEANFFYFAFPVSPTRYAQLLKLSRRTIKRFDPGATIVLTGLFGEPTAKGRRGMPAAEYLKRLYRVPGIKSQFEGVALHPYAVDSEKLEILVEGVREVTRDARDRPRFYITEMGWGSQNNFKQVAFEQGIRGQVRQLRGAYEYLIENRNRLNLKGVYWFSWKDVKGACSFCDSVGLFRAGQKFRPKPAWHAFVGFSGGRARP
ncbi:MAG: hypothetical protein R2725_02475 [Solirubrobacterales bacterium]